MKFKVGDKVRSKVHGQDLVGVIKEIDSDSKPYLVYFDGWTRGHNGRGLYKGDHCWWFSNGELELVERGEKDMKKSDLKSGAIVEIRKGNKYMLLLDTKNQYCKNCLISLDNRGYLNFDGYNKKLKNCSDKDYDIMKVCQNDYVGDNFKKHIIKEDVLDDEGKWTWIREEETVMTISEIEEKLGISNLKIKKED